MLHRIRMRPCIGHLQIVSSTGRLFPSSAHDEGQAYYDFEDSIPGPMWGVWVDGPDPIHFGRAAHHRLADLMFEQNVIERKN